MAVVKLRWLRPLPMVVVLVCVGSDVDVLVCDLG